jgi:hypothetical protein
MSEGKIQQGRRTNFSTTDIHREGRKEEKINNNAINKK